MCIKDLLKDFIIYEDKMLIDNIEYPYIDAKYMYKENQFIRCFILDFISFEQYEEYILHWKDYNKFLAFERNLLENAFFSSKGDERYNLYLIFIVNDNSNIYRFADVAKDFKYARKIILNQEEAKAFFGELLFVKRENDEAFILDAVGRNQNLKNLSESVKYAEQSLEKEVFLFLNMSEYKDITKNVEKIRAIMRKSDTLEKIFHTSKAVSKVERRKQKTKESCKIDFIKSISIKNFRCYETKENIEFAKVNLIYGENGVGKTSLLEAIELGITGTNKWSEERNEGKSLIEVLCEYDTNKLVTLKSNQDNSELSKRWYGIEVGGTHEFNDLFRKWNYFDSSWASAFAIDGQNQIELLQQFLGINDIERGEKLLKLFYRDLKWISEYNHKRLNRAKIVGKYRFLKLNKSIFSNDISKLIEETKCRLHNYDVEIIKLNDNGESISWDELLNIHINKIERIFKFLISSNEYKQLKIKKGEIIAIRNFTNEEVSMAKMSTGQKICLALAFMFSLYLTSNTSPNVIMLDEPVANLDDYHMLNLLDLLRRLAISDTQIFFTTANPDVAKLFRRKFSFLEDGFKSFIVTGTDEIRCETYSPLHDEPLKVYNV